MRALLFTFLLVGACGTADDRPATFEVVSLEVLAPACGAVQCHSTTTKTQGLAFDTLDAAKEALDELGVGPNNGGELLEVIEDQVMPPDSPMFDNDIALIKKWIAGGAVGL